MTEQCKHNTTKTLASWAKPQLSIEACTWCDEILVSVIDNNGVSHMYTVPELTALRQALAAADKILDGPLQGFSSIDMAAYKRAKALAEETAHDEPAALRQRVGELENDLRHGQFVGVFLDSITDTLAHTLWLSDWGMEYADFDEILDPREPAARSIFNDALTAGFRDCHAVVAKFSFLSGFPDDPDEVVYEGLSLPLTHAMYGTPAEQNERIALAEGGE